MRRVVQVGVVVFVALLGAAIGLLSIGLGKPDVAGHARAETGTSAAFAVGSCLYGEQSAGSVALRPTSCQSDQAVFVINAVVPAPKDCSVVADFGHFGAAQRDVSANSVYCLSLVLDRGACVVLGPDVAAHRVDCGTDPGASRVAELVSTTTPASACRRIAGADVWFSHSPSSAEVACLVVDRR